MLAAYVCISNFIVWVEEANEEALPAGQKAVLP